MADEEERHKAEEATHHNHHHHHLPSDKMTEQDHHEIKKPSGGYYGSRRRSSVSAFIVFVLVLAGITALIVWLVYRPHKPKFRVVSAAVYELNTTSPPFISASMQFTVVTRNPNKRVSILYDQLTAFVAYKNEAITPPVNLPPLFHETKSTVAMSPVLGGVTVPVAAEVVNSLTMDQAYGVVGLRLVIKGKLRYKSSVQFVRRSGNVNVRCDLLVGLKQGFVGQLPLLASPPCAVDL